MFHLLIVTQLWFKSFDKHRSFFGTIFPGGDIHLLHSFFLLRLNTKIMKFRKKTLNTRLVYDDGLPIPRIFQVSTS
ncbi:hypothetical protein LDENG_00075850 [Lucifuga dentata]|nr:hypothetical protein LDENG_00075850 [Lucifuga dentata]